MSLPIEFRRNRTADWQPGKLGDKGLKAKADRVWVRDADEKLHYVLQSNTRQIEMLTDPMDFHEAQKILGPADPHAAY